MKVVIPARKGSKGLPGKNRKLINRTLSIVPSNLSVHISTDDPALEEQCEPWAVRIHRRSARSASDTASTKVCLREWLHTVQADEDELIVVLYLTYPQRTWKDVLAGIKFLDHHNASSLLCRYPVKDHPYLCFTSNKGTNLGTPITEHSLYRRQDYPECFVVSHYLIMFKAGELEKLGPNLYNENTVFFPIKQPVDIDTPEDLIQLQHKCLQ